MHANESVDFGPKGEGLKDAASTKTATQIYQGPARRGTTIAERIFFAGAAQRVDRLGLRPLWEELEDLLTRVDLPVDEGNRANSAAKIRAAFEERFRATAGWGRKRDRTDWVKCHSVKGASFYLGARSCFFSSDDTLILDVFRLRQEIVTGRIDVGALIALSDRLATLLNGPAKGYSATVRAVRRAEAQDLPLVVIALD